LRTSVQAVEALVAGITLNDIERTPPEHRRRLAQALRRIADLADPPEKATEAEQGERSS
jgi:hypothetical protein